jgi:hypothetical protein
MPYVQCNDCGVTTYTAPPYTFSADCPVCGSELLPPSLTALDGSGAWALSERKPEATHSSDD